MKYFWWVIGAIVLICVILMMKLSFKPRVISLISPSTFTGPTQFAAVVENQLRPYLEQRRIVVLGLPNFPATPGQAHIDPSLSRELAQSLSRQFQFHSVWILRALPNLGFETAAWGGVVHEAPDWKTAGEAFFNDLGESAKILVVTDLEDAAGMNDPKAFVNHLATHVSYDQYMILNLLPVRAVTEEVLPEALRCEPASTAQSQVCATDLREALEFESQEMIKSKKIDRRQPVASLEQRSSSVFAVFAHSP